MTLLTPRPTYAPFEYDQAYKYWELQQQSHWLHCVAKDQLVVTSNGLLTVEELFKNAINLTLFDNKEAVKSSPMMKTAFRQLYKLHTKEGYTHSITEDHRVMTPNGWTEARNLKDGDLLCIQTKEGLFGEIDEPELAYLAGYYQGNGTSDKNHLIFQVWKDEWNSFIPKIEECVNSVYHKKGLYNQRYNIPTFGVELQNSGRMPLKKLTTTKFDSFNFQKNVIPDFVLKGNKKTVESYLEGLFDTDGTCYQNDKHESIKIAQINLQFMQHLQILLLNFGIKSSMYKREANKKILPDEKRFYKKYDCKDFYILDITQKNSVITLDSFIKIFEKSGKNLRGFINEKKSHPIVNVRFSHLEKLCEDDVYCVSVNTEDHAWICNGFITHNTEISMASDINDWKMNLTETEKHVIGHILKGFTQSEVFIQEYWGQMVSKWFKKPEIQMMSATFSAFESIHAVSYAYLNQSLGLEDFEAFLHEPTAKAKIDRLINTKGKTKEEIARSLAIFSAFNEGVNLFSSFAILLNFSRFNKMKGLGQIISFSIKDESLHSDAGCWLFRTLVSEFPEILTDDLKKELYDSARLTVELEDAFIDTAFEKGPIEGLDVKDMKNFIRHRANTKLNDIGLNKNWKNIDKDSLERMAWFDIMSAGVSHADFFASRVSDYAKGHVDFSNIWSDDE